MAKKLTLDERAALAMRFAKSSGCRTLYMSTKDLEEAGNDPKDARYSAALHEYIRDKQESRE